jgi:hypothetical protein
LLACSCQRQAVTRVPKLSLHHADISVSTLGIMSMSACQQQHGASPVTRNYLVNATNVLELRWTEGRVTEGGVSIGPHSN